MDMEIILLEPSQLTYSASLPCYNETTYKCILGYIVDAQPAIDPQRSRRHYKFLLVIAMWLVEYLTSTHTVPSHPTLTPHRLPAIVNTSA